MQMLHSAGSRRFAYWDTADLLRRSFDPLLRLCIYLLVILPSGTLFHVNWKMLCFAAMLLPAIFRMTENRHLSARHVGWLLLTPTAFLFWVALSQFYGVSIGLALSEYRDLLITLVSSWVIGVYVSHNEAARLRFLRTALNAEVAACVLKIGLLAFAVVRHVDVAEMVTTLGKITGTNFMGADFGEQSALGRIQFTADGLIPLCLFILLRFRERLRIGTGTSLIFFLLLFASLLFTFSRYFWGFAAVAFLLGLLIGKRDRFYWSLAAMLGLSILITLPTLAAIAKLRFSADVAGGSDDVRTLQIHALSRYFWQAPVLGHGYGSHPYEVTRSDTLPYVYEVQLLALAAQEGVVGLALMAAVALFYLSGLLPWNRPWRRGLISTQLSLIVLTIVWFAAGLFNPMLLTSAAAVSYGALKSMSEIGFDSELAGVAQWGLRA